MQAQTKARVILHRSQRKTIQLQSFNLSQLLLLQAFAFNATDKRTNICTPLTYAERH